MKKPVSIKWKPGQVGLAGKFISVALVGLFILFSITAWVTLNLEKRALDGLHATSRDIVEKVTAAQIEASKAAQKRKAQQLMKMLATIAPAPIAEFDLTLLNNFAGIATEDPDISFVEIRNNDDKTLARAGNKDNAMEVLQQAIEQNGVSFGRVLLGYNHDRSTALAAQARDAFEGNLATMESSKGDAIQTSALTMGGMLVLFAGLAGFVVVMMMTRYIRRPLYQIVTAANRLAKGDMTARAAHTSKDELGQLARSFNEMAGNFQDIIVQVNTSTQELGVAARQMLQTTEAINDGIHSQYTDTEQVATAMNEMNATVHDVSRNTSEAAGAAAEANTEAKQGRTIVAETIGSIESLATEVEKAATAINEVGADSEKITLVLDVIRGIAEQTNLLALNAAIEAARAGDNGRGFAVVADEVRTLAQRTQQSTEEIQQMIEQLQAGSREAVRLMEEGRKQVGVSVDKATKAGDSLETITQAVATISDMNTQIAGAAEQQTAVVDEMNRHVSDIRHVAERNAAGAKQTEAASETLNVLAERLHTLVGRFSV